MAKIVRLFKEQTGMTYEVEVGSVLHEVLLMEGFSLVSECEEAKRSSKITEGQGKAKEAHEEYISETEEIFEGDKDITEMSKSELIVLAELMGVSIAKKDTIATIVAKIKEAKGE